MFLTWLFIIAYGDIDDYHEQPISYIFHWISELSTGVLLLTAGIKTLGKKRGSKNYAFLSLGFLLMAIGGAFMFYMQNFDVGFFSGSALILGATIILIILNYRSLQNFILLSLGAMIYGLLNLLGDALQNGNASDIAMAVPTLLFAIILVASLVKRDLVFKHTTSL